MVIERKTTMYSEEIMDEIYEKMIEFLKDHKIYKLMEIVADAVEYKEQV